MNELPQLGCSLITHLDLTYTAVAAAGDHLSTEAGVSGTRTAKHYQQQPATYGR